MNVDSYSDNGLTGFEQGIRGMVIG